MAQPMRLYFITNKPELAVHAWQSGVDRLFVDLEYIGKEARQPGFQRVISHHNIADIAAIHAACPNAPILARINPLNDGSRKEIDACIAEGASVIMLPMFRTADDIKRIADYIGGRATFCPLIETWEAVAAIESYASLPEADEFHFGLTDLSLARGYPFVFQPWAEGLLETAFATLRAAGKPFGVGGVARVGEGLLPGDMVMGEHARVGSTAAMLSQAFHGKFSTVAEVVEHMDFAIEIKKLRQAFDEFCCDNAALIERNHCQFVANARLIGTRLQAAQSAS